MPPTANPVADRLRKTLAAVRKDDLGYPPEAPGEGKPAGLQALMQARMMLDAVIAKVGAGLPIDAAADAVEEVESMLEGYMLDVDADAANVAQAAKGMTALMKMLYAKKDSVTSKPVPPQVATTGRAFEPAEPRSATSMYGKTAPVQDQPRVPTEMPKPKEPAGGGTYANAGAVPARKAFEKVAEPGDDDGSFRFPRDINAARRERRLTLAKRLGGAAHGSPEYRAIQSEIDAEYRS